MVESFLRNQFEKERVPYHSGTFTGRFRQDSLGKYSHSLLPEEYYMLRVDDMAYDMRSLSDYLMYPEEVKLHKDITFTEEPNIPNFFCRCGICMRTLESIPSGEESDYNLSVKMKTGNSIGVIKVCITCLAKLRLSGRITPYKKKDTVYGFDQDHLKEKTLEFLNKGVITNMETNLDYRGMVSVTLNIAIP